MTTDEFKNMTRAFAAFDFSGTADSIARTLHTQFAEMQYIPVDVIATMARNLWAGAVHDFFGEPAIPAPTGDHAVDSGAREAAELAWAEAGATKLQDKSLHVRH